MEVVPRSIRLTVPYRIAGRSFSAADMLFVMIRDDDGVTAYGSATPVPPLTGDDFDGASLALDGPIRKALLGSDVDDLDAAIARAEAASPSTRSALAAIDIALHDLHAKRAGVPLAAMLGGVRRRLFTSVTVGIDEPGAMVAAALRHLERGFRILKVKIGEDAAVDLIRLRRIREAVGRDVVIRVDANEGYTVAAAAEVASAMQDLGIELFEQPVTAASLDRLDAGLFTGAGPPVVADESVKLARDLEPLLAHPVVRGANIKLMKCGGVREARRIDHLLSASGRRALVGCMDESRASIAAAAHFGAAADSVAWIDLDGHLDLAADPFRGGFELEAGEIRLGEAPGLGVFFEGFR